MTRNMADTAVYNNSWGFSPLGVGNPAFAQTSWERAVVNGVTNGYVVNGHPKGVSYIFAAGNGHLFGANEQPLWLFQLLRGHCCLRR